MNSSNREHEISYVISHMFVPVNNKLLRNSKRQQQNRNNNNTPTPKNFEFEKFKQKYVNKNRNASEKTIIKAYKKNMKIRLSFAMKASSPIPRNNKKK